MDDELELAWAAGFFDGEGHAGSYMRLQVGQKDRRPLDRFIAAVGYGKVLGPYRHGYLKDGSPTHIHIWEVRMGDAAAVLRKLWPYLSEPKREQVKALPSVVVTKIEDAA